MGPRGPDRHPLRRGDLRDLVAQGAQLGIGLGHVGAGVGGDLEHRLHQLGLDLPQRRRLEQPLDRVDELERRRVQDHQLLLDPQRVGMSLEAVLHEDRKAYGVTARKPNKSFTT